MCPSWSQSILYDDYYSMLLEAIGNLNEAGANLVALFMAGPNHDAAELTRRSPRPSALEIDEEFRSLQKAIQRIEAEFSRMLDEDGFARSEICSSKY